MQLKRLQKATPCIYFWRMSAHILRLGVWVLLKCYHFLNNSLKMSENVTRINLKVWASQQPPYFERILSLFNVSVWQPFLSSTHFFTVISVYERVMSHISPFKEVRDGQIAVLLSCKSQIADFFLFSLCFYSFIREVC